MSSRNQCSLENGEEDEKLDEVVVARAIARVAVGGVLKLGPAKGYCGRV